MLTQSRDRVGDGTLKDKILNHGDTEGTEKRGDHEAVNSSRFLILPAFLFRSLTVAALGEVHWRSCINDELQS